MNTEPEYVSISPEPTLDERAAILKAFSELWPEQKREQISTRWRFSGRWWAEKSNPRSMQRNWKN